MTDTKDLVKQGLWIIGVLMGIAMLILGAEAIVHDGDAAHIIINQLINVLVWGMPSVAILLGIPQMASMIVNVKQVAASAQVQTAQATQTAQPAPVATPVAVESAL